MHFLKDEHKNFNIHQNQCKGYVWWFVQQKKLNGKGAVGKCCAKQSFNVPAKDLKFPENGIFKSFFAKKHQIFTKINAAVINGCSCNIIKLNGKATVGNCSAKKSFNIAAKGLTFPKKGIF